MRDCLALWDPQWGSSAGRIHLQLAGQVKQSAWRGEQGHSPPDPMSPHPDAQGLQPRPCWAGHEPSTHTAPSPSFKSLVCSGTGHGFNLCLEQWKLLFWGYSALLRGIFDSLKGNIHMGVSHKPISGASLCISGAWA